VAAVRALEVAVLEQRDRRVQAPADVVAGVVDLVVEVDDRLRGVAQLARAEIGRQPLDDSERHPRERGREDRGGEDAELGLVQQRPGEGQRGDQQRDREADAGRRRGADEHGPGDGQPRVTHAGRQPGRAEDAGRLADHVGGDDPQRDR
jgi:hypothetical protein